MTFCDVAGPQYPYLAPGVGLGAGLLQARDGMNCGHDENDR